MPEVVWSFEVKYHAIDLNPFSDIKPWFTKATNSHWLPSNDTRICIILQPSKSSPGATPTAGNYTMLTKAKVPQCCDEYHHEKRDKYSQEKATSPGYFGLSYSWALRCRNSAAWQFCVATCVTPWCNVTHRKRVYKFNKLIQRTWVFASRNVVFC